MPCSKETDQKPKEKKIKITLCPQCEFDLRKDGVILYATTGGRVGDIAINALAKIYQDYCKNSGHKKQEIA